MQFGLYRPSWGSLMRFVNWPFGQVQREAMTGKSFERRPTAVEMSQATTWVRDPAILEKLRGRGQRTWTIVAAD